ncbi:MAG TPA: hypothetical protein VFB66_22440 [Tepidisphaeraceae bacterium]|nr:hypothetical protein [Tepidisphaeraceae bacterium]
MKRRLFNLLTTSSLVLCASVALLWIRSYMGGEGVAHVGPGHNAAINSFTGRIGFELWRGEAAGNFDLLEPDCLDASATGLFADIDESNSLSDHHAAAWRYSGAARPPLVARSGLLAAVGVSVGNDVVVATSPDGLPSWSGSSSWITLPYWLILAVISIPAVWRGQNLLRQRLRPQPGYCPRCGYDLRATPGRCPECGMIPADARVTA